jgi:hypothetical protein
LARGTKGWSEWTTERSADGNWREEGRLVFNWRVGVGACRIDICGPAPSKDAARMFSEGGGKPLLGRAARFEVERKRQRGGSSSINRSASS